MQFIFSISKVARLEGIDRRAVQRRVDAGEYTKTKMPRKRPTDKKRYGIPLWCLTEKGQARALKEEPRLRTVIETTT